MLYLEWSRSIETQTDQSWLIDWTGPYRTVSYWSWWPILPINSTTAFFGSRKRTRNSSTQKSSNGLECSLNFRMGFSTFNRVSPNSKMNSSSLLESEAFEAFKKDLKTYLFDLWICVSFSTISQFILHTYLYIIIFECIWQALCNNALTYVICIWIGV